MCPRSCEAVHSGESRAEGTRLTARDIKRRDRCREGYKSSPGTEIGGRVLFRRARNQEDRDAFEDGDREAERTRRDGERRTRDLLDDRSGEAAVSTEEAG